MSEQYIERYWRDATPADAIKEPPMVARFRDKASADWAVSYLRGIDTRRGYWFSDGNVQGCIFWWQCQVYDAPDPGEGYELIDPDKDDCQQNGIEFWNTDKNAWVERWACNGKPFVAGVYYRRRIAPTVKYVPFTWEDRDQLRGRWVVDRTGEQEYAIDDFLSDSGILYICGHPAEYFLNWRFLDTGEPVGKKVTQ